MCKEIQSRWALRKAHGRAGYRASCRKPLHGPPARSLEPCVCTLSRFSHVRLLVTLGTVALQVPLSMGLSRQEYRSELPFPPPEDLPDPGMEQASPALAGRFFTTSTT